MNVGDEGPVYPTPGALHQSYMRWVTMFSHMPYQVWFCMTYPKMFQTTKGPMIRCKCRETIYPNIAAIEKHLKDCDAVHMIENSMSLRLQQDLRDRNYIEITSLRTIAAREMPQFVEYLPTASIRGGAYQESSADFNLFKKDYGYWTLYKAPWVVPEIYGVSSKLLFANESIGMWALGTYNEEVVKEVINLIKKGKEAVHAFAGTRSLKNL